MYTATRKHYKRKNEKILSEQLSKCQELDVKYYDSVGMATVLYNQNGPSHYVVQNNFSNLKTFVTEPSTFFLLNRSLLRLSSIKFHLW